MRQNTHIAIKLTGVSKRYTIHHEKPTLVERLAKGKDEEFWALKDVNLTIKKGERVGIIGPNGSGKTTLLKIIAGITTPTSGTVQTNGRIVSLIDLEAGFHPELTGIQNIYLNAMLLGVNKNKISQKLKSIIAFAAIGRFIDAPLFTYSAGMKLRLGFSIATHSDPDILIVDEGLSVGDMDFRQKGLAVFRTLPRTKTILFTWQDIGVLQQFCDRVLIIDQGVLQNQTQETMIWATQKTLEHRSVIVKASSNSMYPVIRKGNLLAIQKIPFRKVKSGYIIAFTFHNFPELIIHRVAEITIKDEKLACLTKGDNAFGFDAWEITEKNYMGVVTKINNAAIPL
ncbi:MAG: signal peptidase I [Patescibacteria group bacterium]